MISVQPITNAQAARDYYDKDNFFVPGEAQAVAQSEWFGKGAEIFGLSGVVGPDRFESLLEGRVDPLVRVGRQQGDAFRHQIGWDFTFNAPKSVSLQLLIGGDQRIWEAHNHAVRVAMTYMEQHGARTRLTTKNQTDVVDTGSLVVGLFRHTTSRELDPHLHTHAVVMNMTHTPRGWRAIESRQLFNIFMTAGSIYRNELAVSLEHLGYQISRHRADGLFELEHIPREAIAHFSVRRAQILDSLNELGIHSSAAAQIATLATRAVKDEAVDHVELDELWRERAKAIGLSLASTSFTVMPRVSSNSVDESINFIIEKIAEREARFDKHDFLRQLTQFCVGKHSMEEIQQGLKRALADKRLLDFDSQFYTTLAAVKQEKSNLNKMLERQGKVRAIMGNDAIARYLDQFNTVKSDASGHSFALLDEQRQAAIDILRSRDQFIGLRGYAGTGKTTVLEVVRELLERKGYKVEGFAPSASAATTLQLQSGIASTTLDQQFATLQGLSFNHALAYEVQKKVWIVDESSLISSRHMATLLDYAKQFKARIVFVGDYRQHEAVEAGRPFAQFIEAGMAVTSLKIIMRQRNLDVRSAAYDTYDNNYRMVFSKLAKDFHELRSKADRLEFIANHFEKNTRRDKTLYLIPAHEDREPVTARFRDILRKEGKLVGQEVALQRLDNKDMEYARIKRADQYARGDVVRFNVEYPKRGIRKHDFYRVIAPGEKSLKLESLTKPGHLIDWEPAKVAGIRRGAVEVYQARSITLAAGDQIVLTRNDPAMGFMNGNELTVSHVSPDIIRSVDQHGTVVELNPRDLRQQMFDHNYTFTSYAAQGRGHDQAVALLDSYRRNLVNQKSFLVSLTRVRENITFVTDSVTKLRDAIHERTGENLTAIEVLHDNQKTIDKREDYLL